MTEIILTIPLSLTLELESRNLGRQIIRSGDRRDEIELAYDDRG